MGLEDNHITCARWLSDAVARWLQSHKVEGLLNLIVFKWFVGGLPAGTQQWVRCHQSVSLDVAVPQAEKHPSAWPTHQSVLALRRLLLLHRLATASL